MPENLLSFYKCQSATSSPGKFEFMYKQIPSSLADLCTLVQRSFLHQFWIIGDERPYNINIAELKAQGRRLVDESNLNTIERRLNHLYDLKKQMLVEMREPVARSVANCRDYALLLTSLLRYQNIPARVRSGAARYFVNGSFEDHFICEYWNTEKKRWQLVDPQLDPIQRKVLGITFNPLDLPPDNFLNGGELYFLFKEGTIPADKFGIMDFRGEIFVLYKVYSDFMCIFKSELMPWEGWGLGSITDPAMFTDNERALFEKMAKILIADLSSPTSFKQAQKLLTVPELVKPEKYTPFRWQFPPFA